MRGMVVVLAQTETRWLDWLTYWMDVRGYGTNKSKFAEYSGIDYSTVSAWFNRGSTPKFDTAKAAARALKRPVNEALIAAGYAAEPADQVESTDPEWLRVLTAELREADLTKNEARIVEAQVRGLLQLREERSAYEAEE